MTSSSDEEDDCKPPAAPNFSAASASDDEDCKPLPAPKFKKQEDLLNDDDIFSISTIFTSPLTTQHPGIVSQSPLEKHPRSPRDIALLGLCEVIRDHPLVMAFQSKF